LLGGFQLVFFQYFFNIIPLVHCRQINIKKWRVRISSTLLRIKSQLQS
jgi:hypothetical protein